MIRTSWRQLGLDGGDVDVVESWSVRTDSAAATPAPWPVTAQQDMLRVAAWEMRSPPVARPATIRLRTVFGSSDRYGICR